MPTITISDVDVRQELRIWTETRDGVLHVYQSGSGTITNDGGQTIQWADTMELTTAQQKQAANFLFTEFKAFEKAEWGIA